MNQIILSLLSMMLVACSSTPEQTITHKGIDENDIKEDKIFGNPLPNWTTKSGIEQGRVFVVGKAEFLADNSPFYVEKAAIRSPGIVPRDENDQAGGSYKK